MDKRIGLGIAWVVATAVAVTIGVLAVTTAGASLRGRGPLGDDVGPAPVSVSRVPTPSAGAPAVKDSISGEWGRFDVECRESFAYGVAVKPAAGWRVISWEKGPDDDVDAEFSDGANSVDLEVFCNRGRPTLAEIERSTLGEDDD